MVVAGDPMNQFDYLILNFVSGNVTTQLRYRMLNNPVTHAWTSLMHEYYQAGYRTFPASKVITNISRPRDPMNPFIKNACWNKIREIVTRLNYKSVEFQDLRWVLKSRLNQEAFNQLHYQFHYKMEENKLFDPETNELLSSINTEIHRIENIELSDANNLGMNYVSCSMPDTNLHLRPIKPEQRRFFCNSSVNNSPGDIFLSYATLGKHLYEAYSGDDINLVREGGIRPQEQIKCTFTISANIRSDDNLELHCSQVQEWLKKHDAQHLINPRDPQHYFHIEPLIAQLVNPRTEYEMAELFSKFDFISYDIK